MSGKESHSYLFRQELFFKQNERHSFVLKKRGGVLALCRIFYQLAHYVEQQVTFTALAVSEFS